MVTVHYKHEQSLVPATFGWDRWLNIIRRLFGRPLVMFVQYKLVLDEPVTLQPGESITIELTADEPAKKGGDAAP